MLSQNVHIIGLLLIKPNTGDVGRGEETKSKNREI